MISRFRSSFDDLLRRFMAALLDKARNAYHSHLSNLHTRLNFNLYFSKG